MQNQYEIEIKSLLGNKKHADDLGKKIIERGGTMVSKNKQLNHYFTVSNLARFRKDLLSRVKDLDKPLFKKILDEGADFSIRTRDVDGRVLLVIKASIDSDTSSNSVSRIEFESEMGMSLDELDKLLLSSDLKYQAKWSRDREEYRLGDVNICIDRNAGYGYLAEFEKIINDRASAEATRQEISCLMEKFDVEELPQDRLERMFAHYNEHWLDYYGTNKIFNIK